MSSIQALKITSDVWRALFLREALVRMFGSRTAWIWLLLEPLIHIFWLSVVFSVIRVRHVGGIHTILWIITGILIFLSFRRTLSQVQKGVSANRALFAYRQVQPADVVIARLLFEGLVMAVLSLLVYAIAGFLGIAQWPADLLLLLLVFGLALLLGFGLGMVFAAFGVLLPDFERILGFITMPLMMVSGVIFPLQKIPEPYLGWLMLNPVAHVVELGRAAFAPYYHVVPHLSLGYVAACVLVLNFFGLLLFRRFRQRMVMR